MATLMGEVIGERTVINFEKKNENNDVDHVTHQWWGRTDHATGYQTQLRFNVHPTPCNYSNANHPPRPPPVIIEKLPSPCMSTHDRLQLAALLAKRDFRNGHVPTEFLQQQSEDEEMQSTSDGESNANQDEGQGVLLPSKTVQAVKKKVQPITVPALGSTSNTRLPEQLSELDKMAAEVVSLRRQLRRQVGQLRDAVHAKRTNSLVEENINDITAERQLRQEGGRGIRNMQSLYSLQQQVQRLKSELDKHHKVSVAVRDTKKSLAMKQLAATHRSAIRMLQSFAGVSSKPIVYQQLSELMQQLTACCCQLGLNSNQLLELNEQMKALENEITEMNRNEENAVVMERVRQTQQPLRAPTRKVLPRQPFQHNRMTTAQHNRGRSGHFRAQTFSSRMRKQASSLEPTDKPPKHKRTKLPQPQFTSVPPKLPPSGQPPKKSMVKPEPKIPTLPSSRVQKSKKRKRKRTSSKKRGITIRTHEDTKEQPSPDNGTRTQSPDLAIISNEHSLSSDATSSDEDVASLVKHLSTNPQPVPTSTPMPLPTKPAHSGTRPSVADGDNPEQLEVLQTLQEMLVRLTRIEDERMRIQQRWDRVTYLDPAIKPVVANSTPQPCTAATQPVPPSMIQSLSHYRDRFHHHLKLKAAMTGLNWDSSKLVDELSDEILNELLDSAVNELDEFCEQYAHDVFASEFAIPDTNS